MREAESHAQWIVVGWSGAAANVASDTSEPGQHVRRDTDRSADEDCGPEPRTARAARLGSSEAEEFPLLRGEVLFRDDPIVTKRRELAEFIVRISLWLNGWRWGRLLSVRLP